MTGVDTTPDTLGRYDPIPIDHLLMSKDFKYHPFDELEKYRQYQPIYRSESAPIHYVSVFRYNDIVAICQDHKTYSQRSGQQSLGNLGDRSFFQDPPEHSKIRQSAQGQFSPTKLARLNSEITDKFSSLISHSLDKQHIDFYQDVAVPLTTFALCKFLGLPTSDDTRVLEWGRLISLYDGYAYCSNGNLSDAEQSVNRVSTEVNQYVRGKIGDFSNIDEETFVGAMRRIYHKNETTLREDELVDIIVTVLITGFDTISFSICNLLRALIENREQAQLLYQDNSLIDSAVEEGLRYYHPNTFMDRVVTQSTNLRGIQLKPDDHVLMWMISGNRDEDIFEAPDKFLINRQANRHLGFGYGIHRCIGATLARLEMRIMLTELFRKRIKFESAGDDWWQPTMGPRTFGPSSMHLDLWV